MSEYFQTISTPIDLSSIGLNMILERQEDLDPSYVKKFLTKISTENTNNLKVDSHKPKTTFLIDWWFFVTSSISIQGKTYKVTNHAGNGTYGATAIVKNKEGNLFALKEQISDDAKDDFTVVKEAIINYILYVSTAPGRRPFTPKIHRIFYSTRTTTEGDKKFIYILSEALSKTGYQFLSVSKNITHGSVILYSQLVERLKELYDKYKFNHGDLKPGNVMFDSQNNLRLIDFGFSRLVLNNGTVNEIIIDTTTQFTANSSKHRDLTLMAAFIRYKFKLMAPDFVDHIKDGYNCSLLNAMNEIRTNCKGHNLSNMGDVYKFLNANENPMGTFDVVLTKINPLIKGLDEKANTLATIYKKNPDPSQPLPGQPSQPPNTLAAALEGGGGGGGGGGEVIEAGIPPTSKLPHYQGGAKVKRKNKSNRIYRNYGKFSSYRKSKRVTKRRHSLSLG
jgi:hypothetical protein